jgi:hypothetical protein
MPLSFNLTVEDIARLHWWHRRQAKMQVEATEMLLGAHDPRAQAAKARVDKAWEAERDREMQAMRASLGSIKLVEG